MTIVPLHEHTDTPVVHSRRGPGDVLGLVDGFWALAERIANTEFVPGQLRRRPEAVLAALLSGAERGLGPMESLRSIHVVDGRPGLSAEAMRALVYAAGHDIEIVDNTAQKATLMGRRAGHEQWSVPFTYTIDQARRAGLANKDNWRKYPEDMLLARATARLCRAVFADVTAGLAVTEELEDVTEPEPATVRRTPPRRQPRQIATTAQSAAGPEAGSESGRIPGSNPGPAQPPAADRRLSADDLGGIPGAGQPSWATPSPTPAQRTATPAAFTRRLNAELATAFPDADKTARDRYRHALVAAITRSRDTGPIITSTQLSEAEQMAMSAALRNITAGTASIAEGPDDTIELRGRASYTVTLDPLTVTAHPPAEGDNATKEFTGDVTPDAAALAADETEQPTLDDTEGPA